jgi:hypothetical protein
MVLVSGTEPVMPDPWDESAAEVISGGRGLGAFVASRWPGLARLGHRLAASLRSWRTMIIGAAVLAGAAAAAALLVPDSHPAIAPAPPAQHITITNTTVGNVGFVGPDGWMGAVGCRRGRDCPTGS